MPTPPSVLTSLTPACANQRLLGTALAGLLCLATAGCSTKEETPETSGAAGATEMTDSGGAATTSNGGKAGTGTAGASSKAGTSSAAGAGGDADAVGGSVGASGAMSDTAGMGGAVGGMGAGGAAPELPHITSSKDVGVLGEAEFKALCDERGGTVEVMPHCGGFATAKGFSYDTGTQLLSEHTCMGANTCGGWNCVLVD